jgi:hypothetical protein
MSTVFLSSQILHSSLSLDPLSDIRMSILFQTTLSSTSDEPVHAMAGNSGGAAEKGTPIGAVLASVAGGIAMAGLIAFLAWRKGFAARADDEDDEEASRKTFLNEPEHL